MVPMKLTFSERASLRRFVKHDGTCYQEQIRASHAERFLNAGLITRTPMRYHLTTRGQVELLRQRFRGVRKRAARSVFKAEDDSLFSDTAR